jgi:hypothetical protein
MSGGNENDTKDMNTVFEQLETFRAELGEEVSILVIHHTNRGGTYRGSSVSYGAVDGMIESKANNLLITLTSKGFKDAAEFPTFTVRCVSVAIETEEGSQSVLAVKERAGVASPLDQPIAAAEPAGKHEKDMRLMMTGLLEEGGRATNKQWQDRMRALTTQWKDGKVLHEGWSRPTFSRKLAEFKVWCPNLRGGQEEGGQDHPYYLEPAQPPGGVSGTETGLTERGLTPTGLTPFYRGVIPLETGFGEPQAVSKQSQSSLMRPVRPLLAKVVFSRRHQPRPTRRSPRRYAASWVDVVKCPRGGRIGWQWTSGNSASSRWPRLTGSGL